MITLHIDIKEFDKDIVKELAVNLAKRVKDIKFDVQTGGLLYDLLIGCGLTPEELSKISREEKYQYY